MKREDLVALIRQIAGEEQANLSEKFHQRGSHMLRNGIGADEMPIDPNLPADPQEMAAARAKQAKKKTKRRDGYGESFMGKYIVAMVHGKISGGGIEAARKYAEHWGEEDVVKALQATTFGDGGALVPEEFSDELIEFLRNQVVVRKMGARVMPMDATTLIMGRQNSTATASYGAEGAATTPSQLTTDQLKLVVKKLTALTPVSNDLIRRAAFAADSLVRDDLAQISALRSDLAFIRGDGTLETPKGIRNLTVAAQVFATTGTTVAQVVADTTKMIRLVQESQVPIRNRGWLWASRSEWFLRGLLDANSNFVFRPEMAAGAFWGFPWGTSDQIPINLGGGTNESENYFGEFSDAVIGEATGIAVEVFPGGTYEEGGVTKSGISRDETVVRMIAEHDFLLRHSTSFSILTGVLWGT